MPADIVAKASVQGSGEFKKAIGEMNTSLRTMAAEMKAVTAELDASESSFESLSRQNDVLGRKSETLGKKLELIKTRLKEMEAEGKKETWGYQDLSRQMYETEAELHKTESALKSNTKAMNELGEGVEGAGEAMDDAGGSVLSFGDLLKANLTSEAIIGATKALGRAILDLAQDAIQGYADLEQLAGGVETLFGSGASQVISNAQDAYKTAGLSANEYMETVTAFSASLIRSLGGDTKAAAKLADQAITDMADNANKFGSTIDSIQSAYQGFAKQNYTINLMSAA